MTPHRRSHAPHAAAHRLATERQGGHRRGVDWPEWLRATERKRRLLGRQDAAPVAWPGYFEAATNSSFRLDGLVLQPDDLAAALARGSANKVFRSRQQQRARNHVAILCYLEKLLRAGGTLKPADVVRWYTSIACGLSTTQLDEPTTARLDSVVRRINSPQLRLKPAVQEIAQLHRHLLADPLVPGFNGILVRLLLRYHLGRCGLPPVVFVPEIDGGRGPADDQRAVERLLALIDAAYDAILGNGSAHQNSQVNRLHPGADGHPG